MPRKFIFACLIFFLASTFHPKPTSTQTPSQVRHQKLKIDLADFEISSRHRLTTRGIEISEASNDASILSPIINIPLQNPEPFLAVAPQITLENSYQNFQLSYRTYQAEKDWSAWEAIGLDSDSAQETNKFGALLSLDRAVKQIQFKIISKQYSIIISGMEVSFIDPGVSRDNNLSKLQTNSLQLMDRPENNINKYPKPSVLTRVGWGCPDGEGNPRATPSYTTVTHLIVHHTATSNTSTDWAAVVRSIWDYHVFSNGWSDIGYNYLIDPNGVIYEGRGGGDNVLGAHFSCQNSGTMGIALIGTFTSVKPTDAALNSLKEILSWKADQRGISPIGSSYHNGMQAVMANISGHRDGNSFSRSCTVTECPGDLLYPMLPILRLDIDSLVNPLNDFQLTTKLSQQTIYKGGTTKYRIDSSISGGISQSISLSLQNLPAGVSYNFTPGSIKAGESALVSLTIPESVPSGTYTLNVIGAGQTKRSLDLSLIVTGKVASVSAANYLPGAPVAPESIVSAFGVNLASETKAAESVPLPTMLANVSVKIADVNGVEQLAPLFFVSSGQINYQIPQGFLPGPASVKVFNGSTVVSAGEIQINTVAVGIFSANSDGSGVASAVLQTRSPDGVDSFEQVAQYDEVQKIFLPRSLDLSKKNGEVFLLLFGTGFRHRNLNQNVTATIGGTSVEVLYAGQQPDYVGVDQVNLRLPLSLAGRGVVPVVINIEGQATNAVTISLQ